MSRERTTAKPPQPPLELEWDEISSVMDSSRSDLDDGRPTAIPGPDDDYARRITEELLEDKACHALSTPFLPVIQPMRDPFPTIEDNDLEAALPLLGAEPHSGPYTIPLDLPPDFDFDSFEETYPGPDTEPGRATPVVQPYDAPRTIEPATQPPDAAEQPLALHISEPAAAEQPIHVSDSALAEKPAAPRSQSDSFEMDLGPAGGALALIDARTPSPVETDPILDIRDRYAVGDFTGALSLAEAILSDDPDHAEALRYASICRDVLVQMYTARLGSLTHVPRVALPPDQLRWLTLDHRSGFLLSCIDGYSTIEELLDVSGMPQLDTLRILYTLLQQQIIDISPS